MAYDLSRALTDEGASVVGPIGSIDEAEVRLSQGGFDLAIIDIELLVAMRAEAAGARS